MTVIFLHQSILEQIFYISDIHPQTLQDRTVPQYLLSDTVEVVDNIITIKVKIIIIDIIFFIFTYILQFLN